MNPETIFNIIRERHSTPEDSKDQMLRELVDHYDELRHHLADIIDEVDGFDQGILGAEDEPKVSLTDLREFTRECCGKITEVACRIVEQEDLSR